MGSTGAHSVRARSMTSLMSALNSGAVSVAIEADQSSFQLYRGGVFTGSCGTNLDHGVLVVGYGSDSTGDFWKVKNSWGPSWGEAGYIRLCRNCGCVLWVFPTTTIPLPSISPCIKISGPTVDRASAVSWS